MSGSDAPLGRWPKPPLELTPEEERVKEQVCLEFHDWGYTGLLGWVQARGHVLAERLSRSRGNGRERVRSLEIGCGSGYHFRHVPAGRHVGLDQSLPHLARARQRYPSFSMVQGDAYRLPFKTAAFDRVLSIYTFEHLHRLPECLAEVRRVLRPGGELLVGLPAEGGLLYHWGRWLTSKRHFERKYKVDYLKLVRSEHCNTCPEVFEELARWFAIDAVRWVPFGIPSVHLNAVVVARCVTP